MEEVALEKYPHQAKRGHHVQVRCITCHQCAKSRNVSWVESGGKRSGPDPRLKIDSNDNIVPPVPLASPPVLSRPWLLQRVSSKSARDSPVHHELIHRWEHHTLYDRLFLAFDIFVIYYYYYYLSTAPTSQKMWKLLYMIRIELANSLIFSYIFVSLTKVSSFICHVFLHNGMFLFLRKSRK